MYESDNLSKFLDVLFYIKPFECYVCPSNFTNESLECSQACKTIYDKMLIGRQRMVYLKVDKKVIKKTFFLVFLLLVKISLTLTTKN